MNNSEKLLKLIIEKKDIRKVSKISLLEILTVLEIDNGIVVRFEKNKSELSPDNPKGLIPIKVYAKISENLLDYIFTKLKKNIISNDLFSLNFTFSKKIYHVKFIPVIYNKRHYGQIVICGLKETKFESLDLKSIKFNRKIIGFILEMKYYQNKINKLKISNDLNSAKNNCISNISGDLRAPLTKIIELTEKLDLIISSESLETKKIKESVWSLVQNINDLLDLTGLDSRRFKMYIEPIPVSYLINSSYKVAKDNKNKNVEFYYSIEKHIPKSIITDVYRVKQILINLLVNSFSKTKKGQVKLNVSTIKNRELKCLNLPPINYVKMTPRNPETNNSSKYVRKRRLEKKSEGQRFYIKFEISDTGNGFKIKNFENLFTMFEGDINPSGETELSLAISHSLCVSMNGAISVQDNPRGNVFYFVLPTQEFIENDVSNKNILELRNAIIINHDIDSSIKICKILEKFNIIYYTCASLEQAIIYINNSNYKFDFGIIGKILKNYSLKTFIDLINKTQNPFPVLQINNNLEKNFTESQLINKISSLITVGKEVKEPPRMITEKSSNLILNCERKKNILLVYDFYSKAMRLSRLIKYCNQKYSVKITTSSEVIDRIKQNNNIKLKFDSKSTFSFVFIDGYSESFELAEKILKLFESEKLAPKIFITHDFQNSQKKIKKSKNQNQKEKRKISFIKFPTSKKQIQKRLN